MEKNYLSALSTEEEMSLLTAAQNGDNTAVMALLNQYEPLLRAAARQWGRSGDYEEIFIDASVALYDAIRNYDKGRDVPFAAWARAKVYGDLRTKANRISREMARREQPHQYLHGRRRRRALRRLYRDYSRLTGRVSGLRGAAAAGAGR